MIREEKKMTENKNLEHKIEEMEKRILNGDFLSDNYLAQYPPIESANSLKRFCLYRAQIGGLGVDEWTDNDVSLTAMVTYSMLHDWLGGTKNIKPQPKNNRIYEIVIGNGDCYHGDTITSAWTVFRKYLELLWLDVKEKSSEKYKNCMENFLGISNRGTLATVSKNDIDDKKIIKSNKYTEVINKYYNGNNKYLIYDDSLDVNEYFPLLVLENPELLNTIYNEMSTDAKNFLDNYMKSGNFIAVPECFNASRSNGGKWDTVDRMLWKIYQYFNNKDHMKYLYQMFKGKKVEKAVDNCTNWFQDSGVALKEYPWKEFVKDNLLMPFVDINTPDWKPISLKTGKVIELEITADYEPMPEDLEECEKFFETVNKGIEERNKLIWERCKENYAKK